MLLDKGENIDGIRVPEPIYVVGVPKSGNTWLTRLMADVLKSPVRSASKEGALEVAADINKELALPTDAPYEIQKVHFLPEKFFKDINESPKRIIYIYRDFRDVTLSSFFYFKYKGDETNARRAGILPLAKRGSLALYRYYRVRRQLAQFIRSFCIEGISVMKKDVGTWSMHIAKWREASEGRPDLKMVCVSYEELLKDTAGELSRIMRNLDLPESSSDKLQETVQRQSFKKKKKEFQELADDADVTFGKEFNVKFLRKGIAGDWKGFLTQKMGKFIQRHQGDMLLELGYVTDPQWYKKLKTRTNGSINT